MIRGELKLELLDAKTREIRKSVVGKNIVTNALQKAITGAYKLGLDDSWIYPIATKALGGIMLFESQIPASADNVDFPESKLVAASGTSQNRDATFITSESGEVEGGYKSVWEFPQNKANGTIRCLARTNDHVGRYGPFFPAAIVTNPQYSPVAEVNVSSNIGSVVGFGSTSIGGDGEYQYVYKTDSTTRSVSIFRAPIVVDRFALGENKSGMSLTWEKIGEFECPLLSAYYTNIAYTGHKGKFCAIGKVDDHTVAWYTYDLTLRVKSELRTYTIGNFTLAQYYYSTFTDKYLFLTSGGSKVIAVSLDDTTDVREINLSKPAWNLSTGDGDDYCYGTDGNSQTTQIIYANGSTYALQTYPGVTLSCMGDVWYPIMSPTAEATWEKWWWQLSSNYLGTIYNLPMDIVKTSADILKVTYTLKEG